MAIPARNKARPLALEQGVFIDDVLEDLVEGVAHMQGPVGVGRAVMEGEALAARGLAEPLIELLLGPEVLDFGLPLLGVRPHVEGGLQQVERVLVGGRTRGYFTSGHVAWGR